MFHLSYELEKIALSNLALCTNCQCYALQLECTAHMINFLQCVFIWIFLGKIYTQNCTDVHVAHQMYKD